MSLGLGAGITCFSIGCQSHRRGPERSIDRLRVSVRRGKPELKWLNSVSTGLDSYRD